MGYYNEHPTMVGGLICRSRYFGLRILSYALLVYIYVVIAIVKWVNHKINGYDHTEQTGSAKTRHNRIFLNSCLLIIYDLLSQV